MANDSSIDTGVTTARFRTLSASSALRVLVVDDDELERALIADRLAHQGFPVIQAADGEQGLAALRGESVPLVITDWMMPVMDGIALTERIRALGYTDTFIIMLTSREDNVDFERGYQAGVDDYLSKKIRDRDLLARVHTGLDVFSLRSELRSTRAALAAATGSVRPA